MSGNRLGALKAREKIYKKYGKDFYKIQGAKGGSVNCKKGFAANPALASIAGARGGHISRRGPAKPKAKALIDIN